MIYHYRAEDGRTATHEQALTHPTPPPAELRLEDGTVARRVFCAKSAPSANWPLVCTASGVHPDDAGKLRTLLAEKGVPTEVTRSGDPIYTDAAHRRRALKARGMFDKAAYI